LHSKSSADHEAIGRRRSHQGGNYTEYYCDEALTRRIATAEHDDSLRGGVSFESGTRLLYGLR
jgi:hypothetical protein